MNGNLSHDSLFTSIHDEATIYNTENLFSKNFRDGKPGLQVIQRVIDGILVQKSAFDLVEPMTKTDNFDSLIKQPLLSSIRESISNNLSEELILSNIKRRGGEVGFPSKKWFSDHLPVGAILRIK